MMDPGYTFVRGVRVNRNKYLRRLRGLIRQDGRRVLLRAGRYGRTVHEGQYVLYPPEGRQVYPTLQPTAACNGVPFPFEAKHGVRVTCKNCLRKRRGPAGRPAPRTKLLVAACPPTE